MNYIEKCLIPNLAKNVDESEVYAEYEDRNIELRSNFTNVLNGIEACANMRENSENSHILLAALLILYKELHTNGPWHSDMLLQYANDLNAQCKKYLKIAPEDLLKEGFGNASTQSIFDECIKNLHFKLTADEFKKYPSLTEVYCSLIENIHEYNNIQVTVKTMPISLYLIDDYNFDYKKKGLKSCSNILKHLKSEEFEDGNYYEVIYASLKKALMERDIEITRLVLECLQELHKVIPPHCNFKISTSIELFNNALDQIQSESSLYRKAELFLFMKTLIQTSGVDCISRKVFQTVVCYNLDACCNKGVDDIMLLPTVLCLEEWVKHCWCMWKFNSGHSVLSTLLKVLYICKEEMVARIVKIIATLITLCNKEEKQKVLTSLQAIQNTNNQLKSRLSLVNEYIDVN